MKRVIHTYHAGQPSEMRVEESGEINVITKWALRACEYVIGGALIGAVIGAAVAVVKGDR